MRMMMVLMMLALPAMAAAGPAPLSEKADHEREAIMTSLIILEAAIRCPADHLPDANEAKRILEETLRSTGDSRFDAMKRATEFAEILKGNPPFPSDIEFQFCQLYAKHALASR